MENKRVFWATASGCFWPPVTPMLQSCKTLWISDSLQVATTWSLSDHLCQVICWQSFF